LKVDLFWQEFVPCLFQLFYLAFLLHQLEIACFDIAIELFLKRLVWLVVLVSRHLFVVLEVIFLQCLRD
jgi:hypothetical protein